MREALEHAFVELLNLRIAAVPGVRKLHFRDRNVAGVVAERHSLDALETTNQEAGAR